MKLEFFQEQLLKSIVFLACAKGNMETAGSSCKYINHGQVIDSQKSLNSD